MKRGISKAIRYTGIGSLDTVFGFFFSLLELISYLYVYFQVYISCIIMTNGLKFGQIIHLPYLEKGSNYLLKEFPNEKTYQDSKEKIEEL